jgi:hypothetical protein
LGGNLKRFSDEGGVGLMSAPLIFRTCPFLIIAIAA